MSKPTASELCQRLRAGLVERLAPSGWRGLKASGETELVALTYPVADDIVATLEVIQASRSREGLPVVVNFMHAGVGYEPLQRLAPLLGMFERDVLSALVWPEELAIDEDEPDEDDEDEDEEEDGWSGRELRTLADVDRLATELAEAAAARALPYTRRYATLDALVDGARHTSGFSVRCAALLAAAGRFEEAREELARLPAPAPGLEWMLTDQRAARQLERFIEHGGDPALIPETPLPPRYLRSPGPSMSKIWQQTRARSAAVDAVKRESAGKSREQLREMLERELSERAVSESPLWFEQTLDHLNDTPAEKAELLAKGLIGAADPTTA